MNLVYKNEKPLFVITLVLAIIFWAAILYFTHLGVLAFLLVFFIVYLFAQAAFICYLRGTGVKISAEQFPDLHQRLLDACQKLQIKTVPDAYVLRTDFFNALATRFLGRNYVVLFSDIVDALVDEPDAVDFYFGHELGHIGRGHLIWAPVLLPVSFFPLLGSAYRRAEEYTCDNYGVAACKSESAVTAAIAALGAGNSRWSQLNVDAYRKQTLDTSGFWMSYSELTGDYPWLTKRMASAIAKFRGEKILHPNRNPFAYLFALFTPRVVGMGGVAGLIPVVAIIGILAAIAIPQYQTYVMKSKWVTALHTEHEVANKVNAYYQANQTFPNSLIDLGYDSETLTNEKPQFDIAIDSETGTIKATMSDGLFSSLDLEPADAGNGVLTWTCKGYTIKTSQLPKECVSGD